MSPFDSCARASAAVAGAPPPAPTAFCASAIASSGLPSFERRRAIAIVGQTPSGSAATAASAVAPASVMPRSSCATDMRPSASPLAAPVSVADAAL